MTHVTRRLRAVRASGEEGSALALALVFLMIFGVYVGVVLQFATTGQRTTTTVRDEATQTYAGGGALDGAINRLAGDTTLGVDQGAGAGACFQLPANGLGNATAVTVTCTPRPGSGTQDPNPVDQPGQAVLSTSATATEGVVLGATARVRTQGSVLANKLLSVPTGATLTTTVDDAVRAGTCQTTGTVTPNACTVATVPADPAYASPTTYPQVVPTVPACTTPVVALSPGTYLSQPALQALFSCAGSPVVWFRPGTYYFDFRDTAATHELLVPTGKVLVGGTLTWTPGVGSVPLPPAASACDVTAQGVDLVFGGDSRINVATGANVQLCAQETGTTRQHVVLRGLSAQSPVLAAAGATAGTASTGTTSGTGTNWTNPAEGAVAQNTNTNATVARVSVARNTASRALRIGRFTAGLVPAEASNLSVTVDVTYAVSAGPGQVAVRLTDGTTTLASQQLRACPTGATGCADTTLRTDSVTFTDPLLTPAIVNSLYVDVLATSPNVFFPNSGTTTVRVDGITVDADFSAPLRPTCQLATPAGACAAAGAVPTTPVLRTAAGAATVALHGTVYAAKAWVDLATTGLTYPLIDRGLIARHTTLAMTSAAAYTGPVISIPVIPKAPRQVLMTAADGSGRQLARADVTFADAGGTTNGAVPTVKEWSVG
jgi:hypothetical protein